MGPHYLRTARKTSALALGFQYAEAFAVAQHELRDADLPGFGERFAYQRSRGCIRVTAETVELCEQCEGEGSIPVEDDIVSICDACGGRIGGNSPRTGRREWLLF